MFLCIDRQIKGSVCVSVKWEWSSLFVIDSTVVSSVRTAHYVGIHLSIFYEENANKRTAAVPTLADSKLVRSECRSFPRASEGCRKQGTL